MTNVSDLVDRYVAVWNEPDAMTRRKSIEALWTPDGATCHRLLDARGYDAIESRVAGAFATWVRDLGYVFRSRKGLVSHHNIVKLVWEMIPAAGGDVVAIGLNVLFLDPDGHIRSDYQFNEPPGPAPAVVEALVDRYMALWNDPDARARRSRIDDLWIDDCTFMSASSERHGRRGIEAEALETYETCGAKGYVFSSAGKCDGHHDIVRFNWQMRPRDGGALAAAGFVVLLLDENGRIRVDCQFDEGGPLAASKEGWR